MNDEQRAEHNRAFQKASSLLGKGLKELLLDGRMNLPVPGWWTGRKLRRAAALFERVVQLNDQNWSAMWLLGKIHQRFKDNQQSFVWFKRAYQINPSQPDVAREASLSAMDSGNPEEAIAFAFRATQIEPTNPGLYANLAMAYLLANRLEQASQAIAHSLAGNPSDKTSQTVQSTIQHFSTNQITPPRSASELRACWKTRKK